MTLAAGLDRRGRGRRAAALVVLLALAAIVAAGLAVRPSGAVARWDIGPATDGSSTAANALAITKSYHRRHHRLRNLVAVSYRLEGRRAWSDTPTQGCNDRWIVSVRSLFGAEIGRAEILCDGVEVNW